MMRKLKNTLSGVVCGLSLVFTGGISAANAQDTPPAQDAPAPAKEMKKPKKVKTPSPPKMDKKAKNEPVVVQTVMIFPPELPSPAGLADQLTDSVTRVIQRRLDGTGKYHCVFFLRSLPTVRRALNEGQLTPSDTDRPFNALKIKKLSQLAGYTNVFTSDISEYKFDPDTHKVTLSLSISLVDYSGSKPLVRSAGEEMSSSDSEPKTATEITLALDVARDLTEKLMTELFKPKPQTPKTEDTTDPKEPAKPETKPAEPKTP